MLYTRQARPVRDAPPGAAVPGDRDAAIYDGHASCLYSQALLTLADAGHTEQLVCDVLAGCIDTAGLLTASERGALGLVLFGGFGYAEASREAAISPAGMAGLVRTALLGLATPGPPVQQAHGSSV